MTKDCKKKSIWARLIVIAVLACTASNAQAQLIAGRTNALLWGNLTPNFSLELVTSNRTSVMAGAFYSLDQNPLDCSIKGAEAQVRYTDASEAKSMPNTSIYGLPVSCTSISLTLSAFSGR